MIKMLRRRPLAFTILAATLLALQPMHVWGEEPVVEVPTQNTTTASTGDETGAFSLPHIPLSFSLFTRDGYDDNSGTSGAAKGSWFTDEGLSLAYNLSTLRTHLNLRSGADITYYPDQTSGQRNDVNSYLNLLLTYNISVRLKLDTSLYATYRTEPDFGSNVGPENVRANYFTTLDNFSAKYNWSLRFSTVTSYKFQLVQYDSSSIGTSQNRVGDTFGEELRFNWLRQSTTLLGEYRFEMLNYSEAARDSTTHFALVGIDESFSPQLRVVVRGGATFRSFTDGGGRTDPHFEGSLNYTGAHHASVAWTSSYGVEEPSSPDVLSRTTFRTGLRLRYGITARITAIVNGDYHHDENQGSASSGSSSGGSTGKGSSGFSEDAFAVSLTARYAINRRFTFDLRFEHSEVNSGESQRDYARNRYSAGLTFNY